MARLAHYGKACALYRRQKVKLKWLWDNMGWDRWMGWDGMDVMSPIKIFWRALIFVVLVFKKLKPGYEARVLDEVLVDGLHGARRGAHSDGDSHFVIGRRLYLVFLAFTLRLYIFYKFRESRYIFYLK